MHRYEFTPEHNDLDATILGEGEILDLNLYNMIVPANGAIIDPHS